MSSSATISTRHANRLLALSRLLAGAPGAKLETLLADLAAAFDLSQAGLRWPIQGAPRVAAMTGTKAHGAWDADTSSRLAAARSSDEALADSTGSRFLIPLIIDGRRNGAFWAAPSGDSNWHDDDRVALVLAAQCLAKHPALLESIGVADQVRAAQRLQDAAAAAGKIAHDFDNIFTGVVGFAEMALPILDQASPAWQYVREILSAGNRGIQFTQQLHQLSRSGIARPVPTALGPVLAGEESRVRKNANVRLQVSTPRDLPAVFLDAAAVQVVLASLLDNAAEASPTGGLIRATAELVELSDAEAHEYLGCASAGPFVAVRIADEGPGVADDNRKRLFVEPFFTTKVRHRGLGLPVVYRILYAHRGGVRFETSPGNGSVVQAVFPLAAAHAASSSEINRIPGGLQL